MIISEFELTLRNSLTLACVRILAYSQFLIIALWALLDRFESFLLVVYYQLYPEEEELQGFVAPWGNSNSCTSWPASCFRCRTDGTVLTVFGGTSSAPHSALPAIRRNTYHAALSTTLTNLDMNAEIKFDLKNEDLKDLQELGQGNGGSVNKVEHVPTGTIMAKKVGFSLLLV